MAPFLAFFKARWDLVIGAAILGFFCWWIYDLGADRADAKHEKRYAEMERLKEDYREELEESDRLREEEFAKRKANRGEQRKELGDQTDDYRKNNPDRGDGIGADGLRAIRDAIGCRASKGACGSATAVRGAPAPAK